MARGMVSCFRRLSVEKRKPLTRAQIAELTLRQMGKCLRCDERLDFTTKGAVNG